MDSQHFLGDLPGDYREVYQQWGVVSLRPSGHVGLWALHGQVGVSLPWTCPSLPAQL